MVAVDWSETYQSITLFPIKWQKIVTKCRFVFLNYTNVTSIRNILLHSTPQIHTTPCLSVFFLFSVKVNCAISINVYRWISLIAFNIIWRAIIHHQNLQHTMSSLSSTTIDFVNKADSCVQMIDDTQPKLDSLFEFARYRDKLIWFNWCKRMSWCLMDRGKRHSSIKYKVAWRTPTKNDYKPIDSYWLG